MDGFWIDLFQRLAKDGIISFIRSGTNRLKKKDLRPIDVAEDRLSRLLSDYQLAETQLPRLAARGETMFFAGASRASHAGSPLG